MGMDWLGPGMIAAGAALAVLAIVAGFLMRKKDPQPQREPQLVGREKDLKTIAKIKGTDRS